VLDGPVRRAWHRALAAQRADETIAAELYAAAVQAAARGAQATAAAAAERAAELSQQAARKGHRLTYELTRQLSYENDEICYLALYAWITALLGKEQECRECAAAAMRRGLAAGVGYAPSEAHLALGVLELQLGNAAEAIEHFDQIDPGPFPSIALLATPSTLTRRSGSASPPRQRERWRGSRPGRR